MASTYLTRTPSSNGNDKTATLSLWFKRSKIDGTQQNLFTSGPESERTQIFITTNETLHIQAYVSSSATTNVITNRKFRDTNAWYHLVIAFDTTQSSASDRIKVYVNGVQETSFGTNTRQGQNGSLSFNQSSRTVTIGNYLSGSYYFKGLMSHIHWIDGTALAPTVFGETDSTTGEWKIKTSPSYTVGTNGFFILKDGNSLTDQSANSNNFTLAGGTLTKTEDCPDNIFATFNDNANNANATLSNGSTTLSHTTTSWKRAVCNLGHNSGKWYWEVKRNHSDSPYYKVGMIEEAGQYESMPSHEHHADNAYGWAWYANGGNIELRTGQAVISGYSQSDLGNTSWGNGDIICIALDLDNGRLHARKNNGSWFKSGDPAAGSGGYAIANFTANTKIYLPASSIYNNGKMEHNFGNGYFGTTAVSSAGSNASGIGIFEYDVPTGFTAWSTKGLNE